MDRMEHLDGTDGRNHLDRGDHRPLGGHGDGPAHGDRHDHFERQLSRLMHSAREQASFDVRHQERLRAGVRTRRRVRAVRRAAGSVLAVAGLGLGLFLWPHGHIDDRPSAPHPRPLTEPSTTTSPPPTPSATPSAPATSEFPTPDGDPTTSEPPINGGSSVTGTVRPPTDTATATATNTAKATATATATATPGDDGTTPPATAPETTAAGRNG
ncbi:hypothetical protein [Streptomyces sp. 900105245]